MAKVRYSNTKNRNGFFLMSMSWEEFDHFVDGAYTLLGEVSKRFPQDKVVLDFYGLPGNQLHIDCYEK